MNSSRPDVLCVCNQVLDLAEGNQVVCNATTGVIVQRAFVVLVLRRVKLYQGLSSMMHKYQVKPHSRLV